MANDEICEVCGGTESKLVDGYYYCVECGTQDTNVRETLVEHQLLDDGRFAIGRRTKYSVKMKEGVEMSPEWYKWHTYNFVLAGLTEQLLELGAAPTLRMKVLWIWSRYIKMYQKKDEMGPFRGLSQLEARSPASSGSPEPGPKPEPGPEAGSCRRGLRVDRVNRQVLAAVLALALNHDRSSLQMSHFTRFVTFRLLTVNDPLRFVPPELLGKHKQLELGLQGTLFFCNDLPVVMGRLSESLGLGPARAPDVAGLVGSQLRELRLPPGLGRLVRALLGLLPGPWERAESHRVKDRPKFPDYETLALAYIVVALKMCFGLDDEYEIRLSDAVDRTNSAEPERRPRASRRAPQPTGRLFSFREWSAHLQLRARVLARHYGPLAWRRNMRASDCALMEHFEEFTTVWPRNGNKTKPVLSDQVTMDILGRIPNKYEVGVLPLSALRGAAAAPEPSVALARLVAPPPSLDGDSPPLSLDEDFTQYSLEYAYRRLALPGGAALEGVGDARKEYREEIGRHLVSSGADPTIVYVKDCENKNWNKTKRPAAAHVVKDEEHGESDAGRNFRAADLPGEDAKLETFDEESEDSNIFDDDFIDVKIKEEMVDIAPDPPESLDGETKDNINFLDGFCDAFESTRRESAGGRSRGGVFDSDEERDCGPQFDPATFDRAETIKRIMIAAYKKHVGTEALIPVRFRTAQRTPKDKSADKRRMEGDRRTKAWIRKREIVDGKAAIDDVVLAYQQSLATDAMHQLAEQVRSFVEAAAADQVDLEQTEPVRDPSADGVDADPDDSRDVQVIENDAEKKIENDDDSSDGPAYDPVYKGDDKFDVNTHDSSQLFLKVRDASPAPAGDAPDDDVSFLDEKTLNPDAALQEEINRKRAEDYRKKISWRRKKENIDHLVDEPESITKFNYWCRHYKCFKSWRTKLVQEEMGDSFPRSFRLVMRECAATLGAPEHLLYQRVCELERAMLSLLWRPGGGRGRGRARGPNTKRKPSLSKQNKNYAKASKKVVSVESSESDVSDGASDSQDDMSVSENEDVSKENATPTAAPAPAPGHLRRSGRLRLRRRAAGDPFWQ